MVLIICPYIRWVSDFSISGHMTPKCGRCSKLEILSLLPSLSQFFRNFLHYFLSVVLIIFRSGLGDFVRKIFRLFPGYELRYPSPLDEGESSFCLVSAGKPSVEVRMHNTEVRGINSK